MATEQDHYDASRQWQAHYDETLRKIGMRAPQPVLGQTVTRYRRETDRLIKRTFLPQNHELYGINWRGLPVDVLGNLEPQLLQAAVKEANNPVHVPPGEFRELKELDPYGHVRAIRFIGRDCFVKGMMRPGRRVVGFRTDRGYVDTSGTRIR